MVGGGWWVVCGEWYVVSSAVCSRWCVVCGVWYVVSGMW